MSFKGAVTHLLMEFSALGLPLPKPGLRVLMYHSVGMKSTADPLGLSIEAGLFKDQIDSLKESISKVVPIDSALSGSRLCSVSITFDDGYRDNLKIAAPLLADRSLPFTVFVVPAFVRKGGPDYMNADELKELLHVPGCTIGSHGMNHKRLGDLSPGECFNELLDSRKWLEDLLGVQVRSVAYPNGSATGEVRRQAAAAGYDLGLCSRTDINTLERDRLMLCRTEILAGDSVRAFTQKLHGAWDWHRFRHPDPLTL